MSCSPSHPPSTVQPGAEPVPCPVVDSKALMGDHREVLIRHAGLLYRLRVTAQGKLILTK